MITTESGVLNGVPKQKKPRRISILRGLFWWELVDSNHRSIKQQIYSLSPLATRESSLIQLSALDFRVLDYYSKGKSKMQALFLIFLKKIKKR